jgi:hypothetical protein
VAAGGVHWVKKSPMTAVPAATALVTAMITFVRN